MNKDTVKGNLKQFRGEIQRQWGKLTNDQLDIIEGNREKLAGQIQEAYGLAKDEAERQVNEYNERVKKNNAA